MKILLINHFPLPDTGSGIYTSEIAKDLCDLGHKVCIIFPENESNFEKIDNVKLHPIFFKNEEIIPGQLPFNFAQMDTHPRSNLTFYDMTDEQIFMYENAFKKAIEEEINLFKPDIIHCQHIWIAPSIATNYGIPVVITSHGTDMMGFEKTSRYDKFGLKAVKDCKKIITVSTDNNKAVLTKFPNAKSKTILIGNGFDSKIFFPKKYNRQLVLHELGIAKQYDKIVSYTGKITYLKGTELLIKAAKNYEKDNIATLISGTGDQLKKLITLSKKLGLKNVFFLGQQPHSILKKIYNISDVAVVPSRKEAFGLVAAEALACGTPVIASNIGGLTDIVTSAVGILVDISNEFELSNSLIKILNDEISFDKNLISKYAYNNLSDKLFIKNLLKVYQDCL